MNLNLKKFEKRKEAMKADFNLIKPVLRAINREIMPLTGRFLDSTTSKSYEHNRIIDDTTAKSAMILGNGMQSATASQSSKWFKLGIADEPMLSEGYNVKIWLAEEERGMYDNLRRGGLYKCLPHVYRDMGIYGFGGLAHFDSHETISRFQHLPVGSFYFSIDHQGNPNGFSRERKFTIAQMVEKFGLENLPKEMQEKYKRDNYSEKVEVSHVIIPNEDYHEGRDGVEFKMFIEVYYYGTGHNAHQLQLGGYDWFPVYIPRWDTTDGELFSTMWPALQALGHDRQLQHQQLKKGVAIDKMIDPPVWGSGIKHGNLVPGGVSIADDKASNPQLRAAYMVNIDIRALGQDMDEIRQRIKECFHSDVFLALFQSDRRQITAREVDEISGEKMMILGPTGERINSELLDKIVVNTHLQRRAFKRSVQPPEELIGKEFEVEHISTLAQAQKAIEVGGMHELVSYINTLSSTHPHVLDKFDADLAVDEFAEKRGIRTRALLDTEQVNQKRQHRAENDSVNEANVNAAQAIESAKVLSEVDTSDEGMLARLGVL